MNTFFTLLFFLIPVFAYTQTKVTHVSINTASTPADAEVKLTLVKRFQQYNPNPKSTDDNYDQSIYSPKSANILNAKNKFYVHSLEGFSTSVYDLTSFKLIKVIKHKFTTKNASLFQDTTLFDYKFRTRSSNYNIFDGKPVESTFSHNGKYLWVTYYRRSYDGNSIDPSAVAIIDTDKDEIIRVMPTAPLPKMIACSPDNKYIAVTHWGDNTVGLIDISSNDVNQFKYIKHFVVGHKLNLNFSGDTKINRDKQCGYCLRGTVFTPDSKYLLVGRMGGGGIAVMDMVKMEYVRTVFGMHSNLRHLVINNGYLYLGNNISASVQKAKLDEFILKATTTTEDFTNWQTCQVGMGVRTIVVTSDGQYIFAAVNNESKISAIRSKDMKVIATIGADSFPVGMAINEDNSYLIVTSQGKSVGGGNSVMVYKIHYQPK